MFPIAAEEKRSTDLSDNDEDSGNDEPPYKEGRDLALAWNRNVLEIDADEVAEPDPAEASTSNSQQASPRRIEPSAAATMSRLNYRIAIYENAFLGDRPDPQPPRNLRQYLNALTNENCQNPVRQAVNNDTNNEVVVTAAKPGNTISALPVEVLLVIFSYLDDISLCHVGETCKQWKNILEVHTPQSLWQRYTRTRWPLYHQITNTNNWFKVFQNM